MVIKQADEVDDFIALKEALKSKDSGSLKKALSKLDASKAARFLVNALADTGVSIPDAVKLLGKYRPAGAKNAAQRLVARYQGI